MASPGLDGVFSSSCSYPPREFYDRAAPCTARLHAFFRLRLPSGLRHLLSVEDLVQETLMCAFRGFGGARFEDEESFRAWLFQIARNVLLGSRRKLLGTRKRSAENGIDLPISTFDSRLAASATGALSKLRKEERLQRLERVLEALPPEYREVILLSRIEGLPLAEVAARMQRSTKAVSALLLRALKRLRLRYGDTESLGLPLRGIRLPLER